MSTRQPRERSHPVRSPVPVPTHSESLELASSIGAGARKPLGALYRRHRSELARIAYGVTRSWSDAEDIVQEVFMSLPRSVRKFEGRSELISWLRRVVVLQSRMLVRSRERRREVKLVQNQSDRSHSPHGVVNRVALERALAELPPAYRRVVELRYFAGLPHSQIAERLGISVSNSHVRLFRACQMLRKAL